MAEAGAEKPDIADPPLVILGSSSPRRQGLLTDLGVPLAAIVAPDIDESPRPAEPATDYVSRLAGEKAEEAHRLALAQGVIADDTLVDGSAGQTPAWLLVAADTIVALDGELLGKPADDDDAIAMLGRLSGRSHQVHTGVAVAGPPVSSPSQASPNGAVSIVTSVTTTDVHFVELTDADIAAYVATGEPSDKAGAYGIHAGAGRFVDRIDGNYQNVVGLPLASLNQLLAHFNLSLTRLISG